MLDSLPFVERYAWFHFSPPTDGQEGTALYASDGTRTTVGAAYRAA
ncbi:Glycosyl hydrolase catalytic core [Cryptosporangium aurantiacum]|uniref:Glycosyl hydrolase catalytic core n=2 Tax=Cryptosporangium aurantiacum TaxID=134849 RepID=A0A1M7NK07_9ACTN|nr:Glycosyl hydrolase catalytic core [Cryptosporangium aurantiacum]